jgi:hypothetical protein
MSLNKFNLNQYLKKLNFVIIFGIFEEIFILFLKSEYTKVYSAATILKLLFDKRILPES